MEEGVPCHDATDRGRGVVGPAHGADVAQGSAPDLRQGNGSVLGALVSVFVGSGKALPAPQQALHGRLKRLGRWLDDPHLDELARRRLQGGRVRWLLLAYQWVVQLSEQPKERPLLPILLDTIYFQPFAVLLARAPSGSRGLAIALRVPTWRYQRTSLEAYLPPETS